jgi:hypothetical protein
MNLYAENEKKWGFYPSNPLKTYSIDFSRNVNPFALFWALEIAWGQMENTADDIAEDVG